MPNARPAGSMNDLLPHPGTREFGKLPGWLQTQVRNILNGALPVPPGVLAEHELLPKRVDMLGEEIRTLHAKVNDIHTGQSELGDKLIPLVQSILERVDSLVGRVVAVEVDRDKHAARLDGHDAKHHETAAAITGLHARLEVVEKHISKKRRPMPRGKKKR